MVRLEEVEDETFLEKPGTAKDGALLEDDDDYTDTESEISEASDIILPTDESLVERISALRDIIPPKTRASISSFTSSVFSATSTTVTFGGKGIWILATSLLLLGVPYAIALNEEQAIMEEEKQRSLMAEGAQSLVDSGNTGEAKPAL